MNVVRLPAAIAVSTRFLEGAAYEAPLCCFIEEFFDCSIENDLDV
jgi:hypothetical protein